MLEFTLEIDDLNVMFATKSFHDSSFLIVTKELILEIYHFNMIFVPRDFKDK